MPSSRPPPASGYTALQPPHLVPVCLRKICPTWCPPCCGSWKASERLTRGYLVSATDAALPGRSDQRAHLCVDHACGARASAAVDRDRLGPGDAGAALLRAAALSAVWPPQTAAPRAAVVGNRFALRPLGPGPDREFRPAALCTRLGPTASRRRRIGGRVVRHHVERRPAPGYLHLHTRQ